MACHHDVMPNPFSPPRTTLTSARIDACSALTGASRERASLALYTELCNTADLTVSAVDWRAMGIELGVCMRVHSPFASQFEIVRARSADCHRRADVARQIAVQVETERAYEQHEERAMEVVS